eukprot:6184803-Pleurochrysis_carterae.AAC.3
MAAKDGVVPVGGKDGQSHPASAEGITAIKKHLGLHALSLQALEQGNVRRIRRSNRLRDD